MSKKTAAIVVASLIRSHIATQTSTEIEPTSVTRLNQKLVDSYGLEKDAAQAVVSEGLAHLEGILGSTSAPTLPDALIEPLTLAIKTAMDARMPPSDPMTPYLKGTKVDAELVANVAANLMSLAPASPSQAATAPGPESAPRRVQYAPLDRSQFKSAALRRLNMSIADATGGQVQTGDELMGRLMQLQEDNRNLREAIGSAAERRADAGASPAGDEPPVYVFESTVVALKDLIPIEMIAGTDETTAASVADLEVTHWTSDPPHPMVPKANPLFLFSAETLSTALYAVENRKNLAVVGPTGCGKTTILKEIAARLGRPFYRIPVDGELRRREMIGGFKQSNIDGNPCTVWYDGLLSQGVRYPSIIDLDEFDRADPDMMYAAHQVLEGESIQILEDGGRRIKIHSACAITATANTKGRADGNGLYANVSELSEASRDRFPFWVDQDYLPPEAESRLVEAWSPLMSTDHVKALTRIAEAIRDRFKEGQIRTACSTRQIEIVAGYYNFLSARQPELKALRVAIARVLVNRAGDDADKSAISEIVNLHMPA